MAHKVMSDKELSPELNAMTHRIIGACIEVHKSLGPGLLESAYEECLVREFSICGLSFQRQLHLPLMYKGEPVDAGFQLDLLVESRVVVELKAVESLLPIHEAQVITYLKLTGMPVGLLVNFNVPILIRGVRRFTHTEHQRNSASSAPLR